MPVGEGLEAIQMNAPESSENGARCGLSPDLLVPGFPDLIFKLDEPAKRLEKEHDRKGAEKKPGEKTDSAPEIGKAESQENETNRNHQQERRGRDHRKGQYPFRVKSQPIPPLPCTLHNRFSCPSKGIKLRE